VAIFGAVEKRRRLGHSINFVVLSGSTGVSVILEDCAPIPSKMQGLLNLSSASAQPSMLTCAPS